MDAVVPLSLEQRLDFLLLEVLRHRHGKRDDDARVAGSLGTFGDLLVYRSGRVAPHRFAAAAAEELRRASEEQFQVIVQLGHRPDGRARGAHRVGLVDGYRRRDPLDRVDLRLVHAVEELACIGAEGLDVAPLPLGVERVEDQGRLSRPRNAADDDKLARRDLEREVLEIVLAGAADDDRGIGAALQHAAILSARAPGRTPREYLYLFAAFPIPGFPAPRRSGDSRSRERWWASPPRSTARCRSRAV